MVVSVVHLTPAVGRKGTSKTSVCMTNSTSNTHSITVEGLIRHFGPVRAVDGMNLNVKSGEIFGFLGPNGAGKTTVIRMLVTLLAPTAGTITVAGYNVVGQPSEVRLRIGAALQEAALDNKQTGRELLRLQGQLYGLSRRQANHRIADLSDLVDIGEAMDRLIGTYSGGMKRRLDLAAALIHKPEVLFLDEPTTGLDPVSRAKVWGEVRSISGELGVTIFLTTQYLEEADALANRVGIINRGKLVAEGTPEELKRVRGSDLIVAKFYGDGAGALEVLKSMGEVARVEIHGQELIVSVSNGAALISEVALALNRGGVGVQELTLRTPSLDDVFLQVTGERIQNGATDEQQASGEGLMRS